MPAERPLFSIVMPAYNAAPFIAAAIGSVLAQTETRWELLIVDDGSTDQTAAIAARYSASDKRMRILNGAHRGVSAARNCAIRQAQGDFIAFLDADDAWLPEKLAEHARHFGADPLLGVSFTRARFMGEDGQATQTLSTAPVRGLKPADFLYGNPATTCSSMVAKTALFCDAGLFDESMSFAEDIEWIVRALIKSGLRVEGLDAPLTLYRTSESGLSSKLLQMQAGWETLASRLQALDAPMMALHYARARAAHLRYLARRSLRVRAAPALGVRLMHQALASDKTLLLRDPLRALPTLLAVYARCLLHFAGIRAAA